MPQTATKRKTAERQLRPLPEVAMEPNYDWASERRLRSLIYVHGLPHYKIAGRVFVDLADLDAVVDSGRRAAS